MNDIRGGRVTCYLDDIRPLRSFGEGQPIAGSLTGFAVNLRRPDALRNRKLFGRLCRRRQYPIKPQVHRLRSVVVVPIVA